MFTKLKFAVLGLFIRSIHDFVIVLAHAEDKLNKIAAEGHLEADQLRSRAATIANSASAAGTMAQSLASLRGSGVTTL